MVSKTLTRAMLAQATSFAAASRDLFEKYLSGSAGDRKALAPFVVNAALGIEIYLKTLHAAAGSRRKEHGLLALLDALPQDAKDEIDAAAGRLGAEYEGVPGTAFRDHLAHLDNAFERWREVYESGWLAGVKIQPAIFLMHVLHEVCNARIGR
jgi:hypothetical protein